MDDEQQNVFNLCIANRHLQKRFSNPYPAVSRLAFLERSNGITLFDTGDF
jgi:hypothetical protein